MPTVPQVLPSVQPQGASGGGFFNIQDPSMAFGYGIGKAQEGLGQAIEKTGDMLEKHANVLQDRQNAAQATDMFVEWDKEAAGLQMWHRQQEGTNAVTTLPELYKKQDELRDKYINQTPNVEVRRLFDQDSKRRLGFMIQDAGSYAANQNKASNIRASQSRQSLAIQQAGNSQDDAEFQFNVESALKGVDGEAIERGWTPDEVKVKREAATSKVWQSRLDTIAMTDPFRAKNLYDKNKDSILDPVTRMHIEQNLLRQYNNVGTRYDADSIANGTSFRNFPNIDGGTHREAIGAIESGGRYDAQGPVVARGTFAGQRGVGKYQVMEGNVGPWTKEVLGKEMTPEEFRNDKTAQDSVFDAKFGQLVTKYGNPQDAAAAWHSGRSLAEATKAGATDGFTKTEDYVKRFSAALGTGAAQPLTTESDAGWLKGAIDRAKAIAQARAPDNPAYEDTLVSRVKTEYNNVRTVKNAVDTENFMSVQGALNELGENGKPKITDSSQIFSNPGLNKAYNELPATRQKQILAGIEKNAKADVPLNDERLHRFNEVMGTAKTDPDEFMKIVPSDEDIPFSLKKQIYTAQRNMQGNKDTDPGFQRALSSVHGMLNDSDIGASMSDKAKNTRYNQFVGAFQTARQQWMTDNNGKIPTREDNSKIAAGLLTDVERPGRYFGTNTTPAFEVPAFEEAKIIEAYKTKLGTRPTPKQIYDTYQRKINNGG